MQYIIILLLLLFIIICGSIFYLVNRKKIQQHIEENYLKENREKLYKQLQTEKQIVEDNLLLETDELIRRRDAIKSSVEQGEQILEQLELRRGEQERSYQERQQSLEDAYRLTLEREQEKLASVTAIIEQQEQKRADNDRAHQERSIEQEIILKQKGEEQEFAFEKRRAEQEKYLATRKEEQLSAIETLVEEKKNSVQTEVDAFREVEMQKARTAVETEANSQQKWADAILAGYWEHLAQTTQEKEQELAQVVATLDEYKKKQQAVNEAILRQRAIDEQQDFYRVCLSEFAIEDIKLLQEIRQKLHTSDNLNKLIYDVYVSKSVQEMVKRVLQGGAPSGIYKITRLKTGEIYIGKSTNVKDRWVQHCKTVYGAGTIAHSILHTTMAKDGLEQFTFELVEEVPKEKLTEREKYWIMFYGSKEYGLNERNG